jgi:hypothetical protein
VLYASGQWELEQDYYFSGKTFPSHDPDAGTVPEELIVSYAFIPFPGYDKGWTCYYDGPTNVLHKISLEDAEKILQSWGIKRLDD